MNALVLVAFVCLPAASSATQPAAKVVDLPTWRRPAATELEPLRIGDRKVEVWGGAIEYRRFYSAERLPAIFTRTLIVDTIDPRNAGIEWIFTGDVGGITVAVQDGRVTLRQRFYDSFGLNKVEDRQSRPPKHPEKSWICGEAGYRGDLKAITVTLERALHVAVALNGMEVIRANCLLDLSRDQVRLLLPEGTKQGHLEGAILRPAAVATTVKTDFTRRHQTMIGFGGIATPTAYAELSPAGKRRWWELLAEYNLLIQREYPIGTLLNSAMDNWDSPEDATPHYYGDNFPNGEISDFVYIRTLRKLGGQVWFEFWNLPDAARQDWTDKAGKLHKGVANPDKYAQAMVAYCRASRDKAGTPPDVVGIQNEIAQPEPIWHEMTLALRRELDAAGFKSVKIHMADSPSLRGGAAHIKAFRSSPEVWKAIDYTATHVYDIQGYFFNPDGFDALIRGWNQACRRDGPEQPMDKPLLSTEMCVNSPPFQVRSYRVALLMGELYHKNLAMMDASALCYCWLLLNTTQPSYGWTRTLFVPDHAHGSVPVAGGYPLRVFGAYSRYVRAGMVRIGAESSDKDLLVTAFTDHNDQTTIILLNRGLAARIVSVPIRVGRSPWHIEVVDPYHENESQSPNPMPGSDRDTRTVFTVEPGMLVTLSTLPRQQLTEGFGPQ